MKDNYDFSKGVKNPYTDELQNGYTVTVHFDFSQIKEEKEQTKYGGMPTATDRSAYDKSHVKQ